MKAVFEGNSKPWMGIHPGTPSSSINIVNLMELRWNLSVFFSFYIAKRHHCREQGNGAFSVFP